MQFYSEPSREQEPTALPDCETFRVRYPTGDMADMADSVHPQDFTDDSGNPLPLGWYYWSCFPGCMPDSDPIGPYATEDEAITAAREGAIS